MRSLTITTVAIFSRSYFQSRVVKWIIITIGISLLRKRRRKTKPLSLLTKRRKRKMIRPRNE